MNALAMLARCAQHQHEPENHNTYVTPPVLWREQQTLEDYHPPLSCEDTD